jgi:hypothetical protein
MVEYLSSDNGLTERDEVWGPSAFSEGIINVLYEGNTEYRKELETQIKMFNVSNTVKGEVNIRDYVTKEWKHLNIYRQPTDIPIENEKKAHLQLLIPHSLPLWDTGLIGLCVPPRYLSSVVEALKINGQIIPNAHLSHLFLISGQTSIRISDIL